MMPACLGGMGSTPNVQKVKLPSWDQFGGFFRAKVAWPGHYSFEMRVIATFSGDPMMDESTDALIVG